MPPHPTSSGQQRRIGSSQRSARDANRIRQSRRCFPVTKCCTNSNRNFKRCDPAMKADVAIIGSGPAGRLLGHLLNAEGGEAVVLARKSRAPS